MHYSRRTDPFSVLFYIDLGLMENGKQSQGGDGWLVTRGGTGEEMNSVNSQRDRCTTDQVNNANIPIPLSILLLSPLSLCAAI